MPNADLTPQQLIETNSRLHRRLQAAESEANYYRLRYEGLKNAMDERIRRLDQLTRCLKSFHDKEWRQMHEKWSRKRWWQRYG